jgi:hypothetical protein
MYTYERTSTPAPHKINSVCAQPTATAGRHVNCAVLSASTILYTACDLVLQFQMSSTTKRSLAAVRHIFCNGELVCLRVKSHTNGHTRELHCHQSCLP